MDLQKLNDLPLKHRIGATYAAAICGRNPFCSPYTAWLEMKEGRSNRTAERLEWGKKLEGKIIDNAKDKVIAEIGERRPIFFSASDYFDYNRSIFTHPQCKNIVAQVDGTLALEGQNQEEANKIFILEAKTASEYSYERSWGADGSDTVPEYVQLQTQWQAGILNEHLAGEGSKDARFHGGEQELLICVNVLFGSFTSKIFFIQPDKEIFDGMLERVVAWSDKHLVDDEEPEEGAPMILLEREQAGDEDSEILYKNYLAAQKEEKAAAGLKAVAKDAIIEHLKEKNCETIVDKDGRALFSYKKSSRSRIDEKTLKVKHPAVYQEMLTTTEYRQIRVKPAPKDAQD